MNTAIGKGRPVRLGGLIYLAAGFLPAFLRVRLLPCCGLSASSTACAWLMRPAGTDGSAAGRQLGYAVTLSAPVTSHKMRRARLITG